MLTTTNSESDRTRPQAVTTAAAGNDPRDTVRSVDDLATMVKNHRRSWLIHVSIKQVSTMALIDTGATCTMIGQPVYETLQAAKPLKVKQDKELHLEVILGGAVPALGTANVQIGIAGGQHDYETVISANKENPNCIFCSDFFGQHNCELYPSKQQFHVGDCQVICVSEQARVTKTSLKTAQRIELPARTEVIVECKPTRASRTKRRCHPTMLQPMVLCIRWDGHRISTDDS